MIVLIFFGFVTQGLRKSFRARLDDNVHLNASTDPCTCCIAWPGELSIMLHLPSSDEAFDIHGWPRRVGWPCSLRASVYAFLLHGQQELRRPRSNMCTLKSDHISCDFSLWPEFESRSLVGEFSQKTSPGATCVMHDLICVAQAQVGSVACTNQHTAVDVIIWTVPHQANLSFKLTAATV